VDARNKQGNSPTPPPPVCDDDDDVTSILRRKRKRESLLLHAQSVLRLFLWGNLKAKRAPKNQEKVCARNLETLNIVENGKRKTNITSALFCAPLSSEKRERESKERTLARAKEREREKRVRLCRLYLHSVSHSFV